MEPFGIITKYYPFIDEESKTILDSLMDDSRSYYDFVQKLCDVVLMNDVPINLAYIAAVQAWWCRIEETMKLIQAKYKDVKSIKPWGYFHHTLESDQIKYHDAVVESIEELVKTDTADWILAELHILHAHFHVPMFGDIPSLLEPVEQVKQLTAANPLLKCFESHTCVYEGWAKRIEGDTEDAIDIYTRGLELAETYDEAIHKYMNTGCLADVLKNVNIQDSIARFEEYYDLAQDFEVPFHESDALHDSGLSFMVAGEYDFAISCYIECAKYIGAPSPMLARIYIDLGDGQKALHIINKYVEYCGGLESPTVFTAKARAFALLKKLDEAQENLDKSYELVMKSGLDRLLGRHYEAAALVEMAKCDYPAAMDLFEKSWEIFERIGEMSGEKNRALLGLARAEILLDNQTVDVTKSVTPGRWLSKLEKFSTERDLPGIRMQAALLKSEFYQNHGQLKDAQATLRDALSITESKGVATLRKQILERINEIEKLVQDEEIAS